MDTLIRCNNCMNTQIENESTQIFTCPTCKTDDYLMVMESY